MRKEKIMLKVKVVVGFFDRTLEEKLNSELEEIQKVGMIRDIKTEVYEMCKSFVLSVLIIYEV